MESSGPLILAISALALIAVWLGSRSSSKTSAPVVGNPALFGYVGALQTISAYKELLTEGYNKYNPHAFQIPSLRGWFVFVSGKYVDEMRRAPDDGLSIAEELNDLISATHTLGADLFNNPYHVGVIRKQLTSNLGALFPDIYDEIQRAFEDQLCLSDDRGWKSVKAYDLMMHLVCRASNRLFTGLPLCRDPEFTRISTDFTLTVVVNGAIIGLFPKFLRPLAGRVVSTMPVAIRKFETYFVPIIQERQTLEAQLGDDWNRQKPNDLLQWLMDTAEGEERTPHALTMRMLGMNFAAVHTTSVTATYALFNLAAYPEHIGELREEVEKVVEEHGWTRDALGAMIKMDSFVKETMRCSNIALNGLQRKAIKPFKFSDGTTLPAGAHVSVNLYGIHHDASIYLSPDVFDPFRFSRLVEAGENPAKHSFTTTSSEYLTWGHGMHACPGRFFASQEVKAMMAHIVLHYDVRMPQEGVRPPDKYILTSAVPDGFAEVMFRQRQS